jgi:hypothetical protein
MSAIDSYYSLSQVRQHIQDAEDEDDKRAIRNAAVAMYLDAADREYINFLISLGAGRKGVNLLLEGGTIALSSIGAVSNGSANEISAAVAALTGARGAIDRELYYQQTLPAIVGAMEANRLHIKTQIRTHLLNDDLTQYPVEQAWADLSEYRLAQSLDRAILQVTKNAAQAAEAQANRYENATQSCGPTSALEPFWGRINDFVFTLAKAAAGGAPAGTEKDKKLKALAEVFQMVTGTAAEPATSEAAATAQAEAIVIAAEKYCTVPAATTLLADIATKTGMSP